MNMTRQSAQPLAAVLLDIDGTLLDSNDAHAQAWKEALRELGYHVPYDRIRPLVGKGGDKLLAELAGVDEGSQDGRQISEVRRSLFEKSLPQLRPTPGARALLERLRAIGLTLAVATSASAEEIGALLAQAGVEDLIDRHSGKSDAARSKPDPDIVRGALQAAGVEPHRAILLGDTPHDILAARKAGVATVALRCGGWWSDSALKGAIRIYDDPADLLRRLEDSPLQPASPLRMPAQDDGNPA